MLRRAFVLCVVLLALTACNETPTAAPAPTANPSVALANALATVRVGAPQALAVPPTVTPIATATAEPLMTLRPVDAQPTQPSDTDLPCVAVEEFVATYGPFKANLGKTACLEGVLSRSSALIISNAIHFSFEGDPGIEALILREDRPHFDIAAIHALLGKTVRLRGVFSLTSFLKAPYLRIQTPQQIGILAA